MNKTINNDTFLNGKELKELFSFENVVKQMNAINKTIYGVEPYKVEDQKKSFELKHRGILD